MKMIQSRREVLHIAKAIGLTLQPQFIHGGIHQRHDMNMNGANSAAIAGATGTTYSLQAADAGKYLCFTVIPVAQTGGSAAQSA